MKKLIFALIAVATLSFAACNSNSNSTETKCADSTACDSICADSTSLTGDSTKTAVDTTAVKK